MQILQNVLHSLTKRKKQAGKVTVTAAVAAVFIAVIVVSANGFKLSESSDQENIWRLVYNGKQQ